MSLVKWNPYREMEAMHREMNRLFSQFNGFSGFSNQENGGSQSWILPMDVIETQGALKLKASLPGVDPQDVNVHIEDNVLTVSAERRFEEKSEGENYQWIEQQYGSFTRSVTLPRTADTENIQARYNNGVLELTVPKRESAKPRRIELQTGQSQPQALESGTEQPIAEPVS